MTLGSVFDNIYKDNRWGGKESRSGVGAGTVAIEHIATPIRELVERLGCKSVLDVGCGDGFWMPDLPGYIGIDVSAAALYLHRKRHPDRDLRLDNGASPYPQTDLTISRCVMQHLSFPDAQRLLDRMTSPMLLLTSNAKGQNRSIQSGEGYWINLEAKPFGFGPPIERIKDGQSDDFDYDNFLGLWVNPNK